jgi:hypothetical protein
MHVFYVHHCIQGTGTEQHRHNFAEVAVYNMLSYLWEIETGTVYKMAKPHDIYSGLGEGQHHTAAYHDHHMMLCDRNHTMCVLWAVVRHELRSCTDLCCTVLYQPLVSMQLASLYDMCCF